MRKFTLFYIMVITVSLFETVSAQIVITKPKLDDGLSKACANATFNSFDVSFSFFPDGILDGSNQFIVELSDSTIFSENAVTVYTSAVGEITTSPATISFALPQNISGENFKVRIKSTVPAGTSSASDAFPAYFKIQDSPFTINNLIDTGVFCTGGSYLLTIDNPGRDTNDSPLQYPSLTYKWYRDIDGSNPEFVASGESLDVDTPGTYFVRTDYGSCTSELSKSNKVTITQIASNDSSTSISSSSGNPYCAANGSTTLSAIRGNSYQWYKNGIEIAGATSQTYETSERGEFSVNIDLGECTTSASINLENSGFSSSIDVEDNTILGDGENLTVTVTTDAVAPEFRWFLNEELIVGANTNDYLISEGGNYKVVISQASGCSTSTEFNFRVSDAFPDVVSIPNVITPNGDGINDTWVIPQEYVSGTNTKITVLSAQGKVVFETSDYQNNWPQNEIESTDINLIYYYIITPQNQKTRQGAITIVK